MQTRSRTHRERRAWPLALGALSLLASTGCPFMFSGEPGGWGDAEWSAVIDGEGDWPPEEIPSIAQCGGPEANRAGVVTRAISYDVAVHEEVVEAVMEVKLCGVGEGPAEAVLRFALPRGAVIHRAAVFLAAQDRWEEAETVGRREGEAVYEDVVTPRPPIDPLLIQQIGLDLYRARLYPVDSWVGGRFRVHYAHLLEHTDEGRRLQIALEDPDAMPFDPSHGLRVSVATEPEHWSSGLWEESFDCSHHFDPESGSGGVEIYSSTIDGDLSLDLVPRERLDDAGMLQYRSSLSEVADHTFLHWSPGLDDVPGLEVRPRNVVFVLDVSGSMAGRKLSELQSAVESALRALTADDWFGLVAFEDETSIFREGMAPGTDAEAAIRWVRALTAGGGTGMAAGLVEGALVGLTSPLETERVDLLLVTDGQPTSGPTEPELILDALGVVSERRGGSLRIAACGIGYDLDQSFLNDLVHPTGGDATFALDDAEITGQVLDLFARMQEGGLRHVTVTIAGDDSDPYEFARYLPGTILTMGYPGAIDDSLLLGLEGLAPDLSVIEASTTVTAGPRGSEGVHRLAPPLAAKAWSDRLERRIDEEGETSELVDEAVLLARRYGIVNRYTSMLALESPQMYDDYSIQRPMRDLAGIAVGDIASSRVDESRVGGEGALSMDAAVGSDVEGCTCRAVDSRRSRSSCVLIVVIAMFAMLRIGRRQAG